MDAAGDHNPGDEQPDQSDNDSKPEVCHYRYEALSCGGQVGIMNTIIKYKIQITKRSSHPQTLNAVTEGRLLGLAL
jgi:hypothetical protein